MKTLTILKWALIVAMAACCIAVLVAAFRCKKPLKTLFWSAAAGVAGLVIVSLVGKVTAATLSINLWSVLCAAVTGVPGVVLMMAVKWVWGV